METKKIITFILTITILSSPLFPSDTNWILKKMDEAGFYKTARMEATMEIINKEGEKTTMSLISYESKLDKDNEKSLMRFTKPARLKGTSILSKGDSIWYYNNRTNRVRLLSKSAKKGSMMGSSFSYEDMSRSYEKDYTAKILKEKKKYYQIKMFPKDTDKTYKYLIAIVLKENFVVTKVEYYNKHSLLYKELISKDIETINKHIVPLVVSMTEIGSQKITNFMIDKSTVEFDLEINDKMFSERELKK